jgi:uncharacterized membrane protein YedE/YeeE
MARRLLHPGVAIVECVRALLGGAVIGAAATALLVLNGRIAGVSGIVGGLLPPRRGDASWRALFVSGLIAGGAVLHVAGDNPFRGLGATPWWALASGGLLVGVGASLANGCTSGHGVCGVSRFSPRSIVATMTFMLAGGATVFLLRHLAGLGW